MPLSPPYWAGPGVDVCYFHTSFIRVFCLMFELMHSIIQCISLLTKALKCMQICVGKVTTLHLYQGAFVDIGGVHDG